MSENAAAPQKSEFPKIREQLMDRLVTEAEQRAAADVSPPERKRRAYLFAA